MEIPAKTAGTTSLSNKDGKTNETMDLSRPPHTVRAYDNGDSHQTPIPRKRKYAATRGIYTWKIDCKYSWLTG